MYITIWNEDNGIVAETTNPNKAEIWRLDAINNNHNYYKSDDPFPGTGKAFILQNNKWSVVSVQEGKKKEGNSIVDKTLRDKVNEGMGLGALKDVVRDLIEMRKNQSIILGFSADISAGRTRFDGDPTSQLRINHLYTIVIAGNSLGADFKFTDYNDDDVIINDDDIKIMALTGEQFVVDAHNNARTMKNLVKNMLSVEEILTWYESGNINNNWPSNE